VEYSNKIDTFPDSKFEGKRKSNSFNIEENENGKFLINTSDPKECIGYFNLTDIKSTSLFDNIVIDKNETSVQIFVLKPDFDNINSTRDIQNLSLPFEIEVFNQSRFKISINDKTLTGFENREVVPRTSYLVPVSEKKLYVVFLEQASNIIDEKYPERYSKWLVKKVKKTFANE